MANRTPSTPLRNPDHQTLPPSPPTTPESQPPPHSQPSSPASGRTFDQSWGSIETATHLSSLPTFSWEETDIFSVVVPEIEFSVCPTLSPVPPLPPATAVDLSAIGTVVPETQPPVVRLFERTGPYTKEEEWVLRFLAIQCPTILLHL